LKLAPGVVVLAGVFALAIAGLVAPGPAGAIGIYVWLGVFPGMAIARLLLPRAAALTRWTLGLAISPLTSALAGWALVSAGLDLVTASRMVGVAGWLLFSGGEARSLGMPVEDEGAAPVSRFAWGWSLACGAFVALLAFLGDRQPAGTGAAFHGAIVSGILQHGLPPADPRVPGMPLHAAWIYDLFIAQLAALRGQDPLAFMTFFDVVAAATMVALAWQLAWNLWESERAARGALVLFTLGLNAGAWLLGPLALLRRAPLHAPFAYAAGFWDPFTAGGPLGGACLFLLLHWWALARWWRGAGPRWLAVALVAGAGSVLLDGVVALAMLPAAMGAFAIVLLARRRSAWLPAPPAVFAGVTSSASSPK